MLGFRHLPLKLASIALGALLWLVVSGEQIVERALRIPLEYANVPERLEIVGEPPNVIDVRVRGSSGTLSRVAAGELVAVLDLMSARPGQRRLFHLSAADVRAPFGVEVVQVTPSNFYMTFEQSAVRRVPVVPEVQGTPAPGFEIATVSASPATVEVQGPSSAVKEMTSAITEPVSAEGAAGPVSELVAVGLSDPSVRLRDPSPVRVTVNIQPAQLQWAVHGIPVKILNGGQKVSVIPEQVTVHLRGTRDVMSAEPASFTVTVDVGGLRPGEYQLPLLVELPPRVGLTRVEPAEVRVRVR